jgi:hypothetical protein
MSHVADVGSEAMSLRRVVAHAGKLQAAAQAHDVEPAALAR